jgi:hypothetical protein
MFIDYIIKHMIHGVGDGGDLGLWVLWVEEITFFRQILFTFLFNSQPTKSMCVCVCVCVCVCLSSTKNCVQIFYLYL